MSQRANGSDSGQRARVSYVIARLDRAIRREIAESPTLTTAGVPTPGPSAIAGTAYRQATPAAATSTDTTFLMTLSSAAWPPSCGSVPRRMALWKGLTP